jgi:flagellar basal body-associated protein FliL
MSDTSTPKGGLVLPLIGFLLVTGSFAAGVVLSYHGPRSDTAGAEQAGPKKPAMTVYYPMGEPVQVRLKGGRTAFVGLTLTLQGEPADLLALQQTAKSREPELRAAVSQAAQAEADEAADAAPFRANLPARLGGTLNAMIGTEALPAPVADVLLVSFVLR